jgi:hypothetical protein
MRKRCQNGMDGMMHDVGISKQGKEHLRHIFSKYFFALFASKGHIKRLTQRMAVLGKGRMTSHTIKPFSTAWGTDRYLKIKREE